MKYSLRELKEKDAPLMLEWMKDPEVNQFFRFDADTMTIESCLSFIRSTDPSSQHYAIVDESDEYLGTISLKSIENGEAEYAISLRRQFHGTGAASKGTQEILRIGFEEIKLNRIYLNVLSDNKRANRFYKKMGFTLDREEKNALEIKGVQRELNWYSIDKGEFFSSKNEKGDEK